MPLDPFGPAETFDAATVRRALAILVGKGEVFDVRIGGVLRGDSFVGGFYNDPDKAAQDITGYETRPKKPKVVYVTLNTVHESLLARYYNRMEEYAKNLTADEHITRRVWLLVDCDPSRFSEISSTDAEHEASLERCRQIARTLRAQGWPDPVFGDSGNGGHLLYRIDLPNDDGAKRLCENSLKALAARFDDDVVTIDQKVFNAGRITKLYGTWARKGDNTPQRPHRLSKLVYVPISLDPDLPEYDPVAGSVPLESLIALAAEAPAPAPVRARVGYSEPLPPFDMDGFLQRAGLSLAVNDPMPYAGGTKWQLDCPFNPDHKSPDAILTLSSTGAPGFKCSHASCIANDFAALRDKLEPGWRNKRAKQSGATSKTSKTSKAKAGPNAASTLDSSAEDDEEEDEETEPGDTRGPSVSTRLVELVRERAHLWKTPEGATFATLKVGALCETWPIESSGFKRILRRLYYEETGRAPSASAVTDAANVLDSVADGHGDTQTAHNRKAFHVTKGGPVLYLDLADEQWRIVRVTPDGWTVLPQTLNQPVRFKRSRGMLPLPLPVSGGDIGELRRFVNVSPADPDGPGDFALLVSWPLAALGPHRPYPVLNLAGEQGSAKSSTARTLRALVDPAKPALRPEPRDERDIAIACTNAFTVAYDNLSFLPNWLSDALCRVSTGGGFGTRRMYTNDEEALFDFMAPVILTGIGESASRPDLLERSLLLTLPTISDEDRQDEDELNAAFEEARPRLLGALLDAVAHGLRHLPETRLARKPRMADFARWITACETGGQLGWPAGTFLDLYEANREAAIEVGLEATSLAPLLTKLLTEITGDGMMQQAGVFEGTAAELLQAVSDRAADRDKKRLPTNARALSVALRRIEPALRQTGIGIEHKRAAGGNRERIIRIARGTQNDLTGTQNRDAKQQNIGATSSSRDAKPMWDAKKQPFNTPLEEVEKGREEGTNSAAGDEDESTRIFASHRPADEDSEPEEF